jgi:hypothetical protein
MAIDPNIALGVRGIEVANPLAQYSQVAQIQNAQNQNQLAQYQLTNAQREQESVNALNQAYADAYDSKTGQIDANALRKSLASGGFGSKLPAVEKGLLELGKLKTETQKAETELLGSKLKQSREFLNTIDPFKDPVAAGEQYIAWHEANHKDPIIGAALAARGVTADQSRARIADAISRGPQALANAINESKLGTEKFMELNKPTTNVVNRGGQTDIVQIPGLGGTPAVAGTYQDVPLPANVAAQKKEIARAGASNLNVNTEKTYGSKFGGLIAESDAAKLSAAENAPRMAENADRIADLLATGKVITGTGANARLQLAKALNLAGGSDSERIKNTEVLVSSLAETTLGAIKASNLGAGQGFTNADRDFLEKAVAGQLSYDQKSLGELARLSRKAAEKSAESWNKRSASIPKSALEGTGISTEPVVIPPRKTSSVMNIPAGAISALKAGQGSPEQFDAIFGAGSAKRILGEVK